MAATIVNVGNYVNAASGNVTPGLPSGWAADDIILVIVVTGDNVAVTLPAGWTSVLQTNNGANLRRSIFYRRAVAGDTAPLVTHTGGDTILAVTMAFRGCITSGNPINATGEQSNASSTTTTAPTITPGAGELCLWLGAGSNADTSTAVVSSAYSGTNPTYTIEALDIQSGLGTREIWAGVAYGVSADGSATGSRTGTTNAAVTNIGTQLSLISDPWGGPQYVAAGIAQNATTGITVPWPPHVVDDVGILVLESCGGEPANLGTANGFVAVTNSPQATGALTAGTQLSLYWCRATSTSMAAPIVTDPGDHVYGVILTFRGCKTSGDPVSVTAGSVKASASTTTTWGTITTTVANALVAFFASRDTDSSAAAWSAHTGGNVTNRTEVYDAGTTSGNGGGVVCWTGRLASPGASGSPTATVASSINAMLTLQLETASSGITGTGAVTIGAPAVAGTGTFSTTGSGTVAIGAPALSGSGTAFDAPVSGTGAVTIQAPVLAGSGTFSTTGSGALTIAAPSVAGVGTFTTTGSGAASIAPPSISGAGTTADPGTGSGGVTIGPPAVAASGTHTPQTITGAGDLTLAGPTLAASGTYTPAAIDATGAVTIGHPSIAGSGTFTPLATISGDGTVTILAPALFGAGTFTISGTGALTIDGPSISGVSTLATRATASDTAYGAATSTHTTYSVAVATDAAASGATATVTASSGASASNATYSAATAADTEA